MNDNDNMKKIEAIYSNFILKMKKVFSKREKIINNYSQRLEEAKIKEVRDSISLLK